MALDSPVLFPVEEDCVHPAERVVVLHEDFDSCGEKVAYHQQFGVRTQQAGFERPRGQTCERFGVLGSHKHGAAEGHFAYLHSMNFFS